MVRVVWADRSKYRGGIGWTMRGTCDNGKKFGAKLRSAASEWTIDWPSACGSELDVELHVQVNWMRCPSKRTAERVTPGSVIVMPLADTQACKGHPDDPDVR